MTILDLIKAACKTKGVPEKYAERIQKTFKIDKAEGLEASVDLFKENILPAIQEAENEAKASAEAAAVTAYEEKYGLKDGKPVKAPNNGNDPKEVDLLKGISPELKAYLDGMKKSFDEAMGEMKKSITTSADDAKKESVRKLLKESGLPEDWISRVDIASEVSIEEQVNKLSDEYVGIQQKAINDAVARGDYSPGPVQIPERSEADWVKLMNGDVSVNNEAPGVVNLGIE